MSADYRNPTEVEVNKIISADVREGNRALLAGDLLKAMDITACLAAEKHAKMPCVTLIMDDLVVNDDLLNGQVLNVKAKLSRAFGSSMEVVVEASLEDMFKQERVQICKACFVFIAIAKVGKAKLANLDLVTVEERLEYALAYERRKLRYAARNAAKAKSTSKGSASDTCTTRSEDGTLGPGEVAMSKTVVESVELVLPSQANHHQTTFGGQIMAWLVSACTISASRLCQTRPSIVEVNGVHFLEKSSVGDRLLFKAMVNKTFDDNTLKLAVEWSPVAWKVKLPTSTALISHSLYLMRTNDVRKCLLSRQPHLSKRDVKVTQWREEMLESRKRKSWVLLVLLCQFYGKRN
jgi:acyl-CoA thioesterase 11